MENFNSKDDYDKYKDKNYKNDKDGVADDDDDERDSNDNNYNIKKEHNCCSSDHEYKIITVINKVITK